MNSNFFNISSEIYEAEQKALKLCKEKLIEIDDIQSNKNNMIKYNGVNTTLYFLKEVRLW